MFVSNI